MIHISELGGDYYHYDEARQELRGERTGIRYRLTDRVHVLVSRVDLDARRIEFSLVKPGQDRNNLPGSAGRFSAVDAGKPHKRAAAKKTRPEEKKPVKGSGSGPTSYGSSQGRSAEVGRSSKKTAAAKAGKKPKKASNAKSKGHELSIRKGRR